MNRYPLSVSMIIVDLVTDVTQSLRKLLILLMVEIMTNFKIKMIGSLPLECCSSENLEKQL